MRFDSDSFVIGIDQGSSATISNNSKHFRSLTPVTTKVVGVDGVPRGIAAGIGTIHWKLEDDNGRLHSIVIRNAYYIPQSPKCLLPPQHFARHGNTSRDHTVCNQFWNRAILRFGPKGEFTKTVYHHETDSGTPDMFSAPATSKYSKYSMQADLHQCVQSFEVTLPPRPQVDLPHVVSDSESDSDSESETTVPGKTPTASPSPRHDEGGSIASPAPESDAASEESIEENIHDFASGGVGVDLIRLTISSTLESATARPSRICALCLAFRNSNVVLRVTTSFR